MHNLDAVERAWNHTRKTGERANWKDFKMTINMKSATPEEKAAYAISTLEAVVSAMSCQGATTTQAKHIAENALDCLDTE